jgi:2-polyprenyl-6-methoxyphenol hydroxylase-like FAD-dependent oxidoreductase
VKLHSALKEAAIAKGAVLHLSSPITSVDARSGIIRTGDGQEFRADAIIAADGVHSIARTQTFGDEHKPFSSGKSAFRFLIPRKLVEDDTQTRQYLTSDGELVMIYHKDRRLVMYPTSDNTLLNFVCIHPDEETASASSGDWNNKATLEMLLAIYQDFHEDFKAILRKADESSLKIWTLLDMVRNGIRVRRCTDWF